jgi:hypothetical protein
LWTSIAAHREYNTRTVPPTRQPDIIVDLKVRAAREPSRTKTLTYALRATPGKHPKYGDSSVNLKHGLNRTIGSRRRQATRTPQSHPPPAVRASGHHDLKRDTIAHLGTLDFVAAKDNVVFLGPVGTG